MRRVDEIWNRATRDVVAKELTAPGDRALADLLLAHSLAMNGGVLHSIECMTAEERVSAVSGFRYFGLDAAADVLQDILERWHGGHLDSEASERLEFEADERYNAIVIDDGVLATAFEIRFNTEPTAFAGLE